MSTDTEKLPLYIEGPQIQTRLEDVAAAFRRLAMLRLAEAELPKLIADAQSEADAACLALGLSGDHRAIGRLGAAVPTQPDAEPNHGDGAPVADVPEAVLAGDPPSASETESADARASAEAGSGHPVEVVEPAGGAPIAPGSPLTQPDESAGAATPAEAEAHTPAEGAVEPARGVGSAAGSPLTPAPQMERRPGRPLGDVSQACLRVLELAHPHPATAADIVTASGFSLDKVRQRLYALSSSGRITRDDSKGEPLWGLEPDEAPVVTAALAAAGMDGAA